MKKGLIVAGHLFMIVVLTISTQSGGVIYLASILIAMGINRKEWYMKLVLFIALYAFTSFIIIPVTTPLGGRQRIIDKSNIEAATWITKVLNRNYVTIEMNTWLDEVSDRLQSTNPSIKMRYLDACFPFFDGFPLLPHLSHNDGKKIDFSLVYEDQNGCIVNEGKSNSGYGVFEEPTAGEINQTKQCLKQGHVQYEFPKYLTLGNKNPELRFSKIGTRHLLQAILQTKGLAKVFIEPHLKIRMGITDSRVRFQGCQSVRHDDHIHVQIK